MRDVTVTTTTRDTAKPPTVPFDAAADYDADTVTFDGAYLHRSPTPTARSAQR